MTASQRQVLIVIAVMTSIAIINYVLFGLIGYDAVEALPGADPHTALDVHTLGVLEWRRTEISMTGELSTSFQKNAFIVSIAISVAHLAACLGIMWKVGKPASIAQPIAAAQVGE